jgi:1-acyl-sn-glycerol-3-phosphate acyltransferase
MLYPILKVLCRTSIQCYFSSIEFNGTDNIPKGEVPVIFAANHQSAFLDAILLAVFSKEPIYFLARSDVFNGPLKHFLLAINMMPIYRMRDGIGKLSLNDAIFEKCSQLLSENKRILIFPEGSQADVAYLRPLTKGIARIALRTQQNLKQDIKIMPLGINYFNSFHSGHKLMFNYGKPLSVSSFNKEFELHENKGFQALLKGVSEGIKQQLLIPVETLDYEDKILALNRKNEKENFKSLKSKIAEGNFEKSTSTHKWTKILKYILYIPNLPAVGVLSFILNKLTTDKHFIASMKVAFGALIFPFWLMLSFMLSLIFLNVKFAFVILFIQYLAMYLVPKVSRWSRV